jgi:hypothetical protein
MENKSIKLLSFDIEISDVFELKPNEDMEKYAPFHISVAAAVIHGGEELSWYSNNKNGTPLLNLTKQVAQNLLKYLEEMQNRDYMICAWNGLSFDLKWIGYQANDMELAARIALKSYDPMFQFFNQTGFPVGLSKVAKAMDIKQEKSMDGADAPKEWVNGNYKKVINYCIGDCQMTNLIILKILKEKMIKWVTGKGYVKAVSMLRLKTVKEVIEDPGPDQSWMSKSIPKTRFYEWIKEGG